MDRTSASFPTLRARTHDAVRRLLATVVRLATARGLLEAPLDDPDVVRVQIRSAAPSEQLSWVVRAAAGRGAVVDGRHRLDDWLATRVVAAELVGPAQLVFEELLAASLARGAEAVEVAVALDGDAIRLAASTDLPEPDPVEVHEGHDGEGWGMVLIDQLATRWGMRPRLDHRGGSTMWAEVLLA